MGFAAEELADLVKTTLNELGKGKWSDIVLDKQEYIFMPNLLRDERIEVQSGPQISFNVRTGTAGNARRTQLFTEDSTNIADTMTTGTVPWRHYNTSYGFDVREIKMNREPSQIVNLIKTRRHDSLCDLANLLEDDFVSKPVDSNDKEQLYGMLMWIVKNTSKGFYGGNPSGFSGGVAGLDTAVYARYKNYTDTYATLNKSDAVAAFRELMQKTNFKSPYAYPEYNTGDRYVIYTNYTGWAGAVNTAESQNENLGYDLDNGRVTLHGNPIIYVPALDADTTDPFYFVNWGVFKIVCLAGEYLEESEPLVSGTAHKVVHVQTDLTLNTICYDRRRLGVIYKV